MVHLFLECHQLATLVTEDKHPRQTKAGDVQVVFAGRLTIQQVKSAPARQAGET
jgi:hypothetical protein